MKNITVMQIAEIIFWGALALLYLNVRFQYQEFLIGICAGAICIIKIVGVLQQQ